ncbi:unnamed protein product, partial [Mesorhabditis spiculigera]
MKLLVVAALLAVASAASFRVRRDHHEPHDYSVDTLTTKVLTWLTDDQKAALKALENDKDALLAKVEEYFKGHDKKDEAADKIIHACKHVITDAIGDEKASELKKLKESGAAVDQMEAKVTTFLDEAADSEAKTVAKHIKDSCKKVFQYKATAAASRKRRDAPAYNLDLAIDKVLTWLSAEQKAELKGLEGDKQKVLEKIGEYFKALTGDVKKEAVEKVKGACKAVFSSAVGEDKLGEVKKIKEAGGSIEDIEKKVNELVEAAADSEAKTLAVAAQPHCKKAFQWKADA